MWTSFCLAVAVGVIILYLPGYVLGRALALGRVASVCCAPLLSVAVSQGVCVVCGFANITCTGALVFLSTLVLALVAFAARAAAARKGGRAFGGRSWREGRYDWLCVAAYVAMGVILGLYAYVGPLGDPAQFSEGVDNTHHLNSIRSFLESGVWSSLSVTLYPESGGARIDPTPGSGFYPSGWHMVAAVMVQATGCEVVVAEHAANFVFLAFVFATSMFLLMRVIFVDRRGVVAAGALFACAFAMFPWSFTYFGPLYPNLSSYAAMPAVAACFMSVVAPDRTRGERVRWAVTFALGMVALVLLQTNAVFSVAAFLIAFCVWRVWGASRDAHTAVRLARCAGFVVFAGVVWTALFYAPPLRSVVTHEWIAFESYPHGLFDVATMGFRGTAQLGLAFLALVGAVSTLLRGRGRAYAWVTASMTLFGIMYVVDVASNAFIKFYLTGFWYTDSFRVAASAVLCVVPLVTWGAYCVFDAARRVLTRVCGGKACAGAKTGGAHARRVRSRAPEVLACALVVAIAASVYAPGAVQVGNYQLKTAFQHVRDMFGAVCDPSLARVYSPAEQDFVDKVREVVPDGAGIVNQPNDGSGFAYGTDQLNVVYRFMRGVGGPGERAESVAMRERLYAVASDAEVRDAVHALGVEYVLQLDHESAHPGKGSGSGPDEGPDEPDGHDKTDAGAGAGADAGAAAPETDAFYLFCYVPEEWAGINAVDDDTPGFEVVLSEGDMRLYRIVA